MAQSLAVKYRPKNWEDVTEQEAVKVILQNQLETGEIRHAYLFCGGAGTGKTTCARIFANEINKGQGNPIEMDAASNNSVEDIRTLSEQAKTRSLDSEYKIFILDECHSLSNSAWQAMLKLIEEPPAKTIFIFCTTDPQKIPKTILSRVQRYDFQRISQSGVVNRLHNILVSEQKEQYYNSGKPSDITYKGEALEYLAKIADGGMRDAITMLDKCLAYSPEISLDSVVEALGVAEYSTMMRLTDYIHSRDKQKILEVVNAVHAAGKDLKQFIRQYLQFILDVCIYNTTKDIDTTSLPASGEMQEWLDRNAEYDVESIELMDMIVKLNTEIKWDPSPKMLILSQFLLFTSEG